MRNAVIAGSGYFVPEKVVPNSFFNEILKEDVDTWLKENVQIYERRWCSDDESTADLCVNAANKAMADAGITAEDLNLIIISTDTPEYISPSTASVVQHRINAVNAGSFDVNTACAGFVTALDMGFKYIQADSTYKYILVIGAYAMSKYLDLTDKKTVTLFADGAGAVILKAEEDSNRGLLVSSLSTQGQYCDWMGIYAGGTKYPMNQERLDNKDHLLKFVKKFPKELNPYMWTKLINDACAKIFISPKDIDHFFFTQININTIWETLDNLEIDRSKAPTIMHKYGYTGSAAIPMAFADAKERKIIKLGDIACFMGSGGGLAFACAIVKF